MDDIFYGKDDREKEQDDKYVKEKRKEVQNPNMNNTKSSFSKPGSRSKVILKTIR